METSDLLVLVFLILFVGYGVVNMIAVPVMSRKFFRENKLTDTGKSTFEAYADSEILEPLATKHLHTGQYRGYAVLKAKCFLQKRSLLTFSKIQRKRLQSRWSATILDSTDTLPSFSLLEKTDPRAVLLMLSDPGVDLSFDDEIQKRYLLRTEESGLIVPLVTGDIRDFLMDSQLASIESINNSIVIKRSWPIERTADSLLAELDCAVTIADKLGTNQ